jgi:hypothetical protein
MITAREQIDRFENEEFYGGGGGDGARMKLSSFSNPVFKMHSINHVRAARLCPIKNIARVYEGLFISYLLSQSRACYPNY